MTSPGDFAQPSRSRVVVSQKASSPPRVLLGGSAPRNAVRGITTAVWFHRSSDVVTRPDVSERAAQISEQARDPVSRDSVPRSETSGLTPDPKGAGR